MRAKKAPVFHILRRCFIAMLALLMSLMPLGCAGSNGSTGTSNPKESTGGYKEVTYKTISFTVPEDFEFEEIHFKDLPPTISYAPDFSNDEEVNSFGITLLYDEETSETAQERYEGLANYEECDLVSANGIEICCSADAHSADYADINYYLEHDGVSYTIVVHYNPSSKTEKEFAGNFYKSIRPVGSVVDSGTAETSSDAKQPSPAIPDGAIEWSKAGQYVGKTATFYGKVVDSEYASGSNGKPTFLDVGAAYPDNSRLSMVIWGENRSAFSSAPESTYEGKTVAVTGEVYRYDGVCNIEITSPSQIEILD